MRLERERKRETDEGEIRVKLFLPITAHAIGKIRWERPHVVFAHTYDVYVLSSRIYLFAYDSSKLCTIRNSFRTQHRVCRRYSVEI